MRPTATPLLPADGLTSWCIAAEWGYPDSAVLWLWTFGWCFVTRLQGGTIPAIVAPPAPPLRLPAPLHAIYLDDGYLVQH